MRWLPFDSFVVATPATINEIVTRLQPHVAPSQFIGSVVSDAEFVGWLSEDGFRLQRRIATGVSFVPDVYGRFLSVPDGGTHVHVEVIPNIAALMIIAIVCGFLGFLVFHEGPVVFLAAAGGLLVSWLCAVAGFWIEGGASRRALVRILKDEG